MSTLMIHETQNFRAIVELLERHKLDFAVLGGYPRDLFHGFAPKDLDICVFGYNSFDICVAERVCTELGERGFVEAMHLENGSARNDASVSLVLTLKGDIDVIFWNACTKEEVLQLFDFNFNQFELELREDGVKVGIPPVFTQLAMLRDDLSPERIDRMIQKAKDYGWDTCQVQSKLKSSSLPTPITTKQN